MPAKKKKTGKTISSVRYRAISMTGFGRASASIAGVSLDCEIRTLNNRFLDLNLKLPRLYVEFEAELRSVISNKLTRGRVDITVVRSQAAQASPDVTFHAPVFKSLMSLYTKVAREQGVLDKTFHQQLVLSALGRRDVVEIADDVPLQGQERKQLVVVVSKALDAALSMRAEEGQRLAKDLGARINTLKSIHHDLEDRAAKSPDEIQTKLLRRIAALSDEAAFDQQRLASEVAILADRVDVTEELVRIESHLGEALNCLLSPGNGKKLEFLTQELGREFNTISSKSADATTASLVVEAKTQLERIKEQAQNLE